RHLRRVLERRALLWDRGGRLCPGGPHGRRRLRTRDGRLRGAGRGPPVRGSGGRHLTQNDQVIGVPIVLPPAGQQEDLTIPGLFPEQAQRGGRAAFIVGEKRVVEEQGRTAPVAEEIHQTQPERQITLVDAPAADLPVLHFRPVLGGAHPAARIQ